MRDANTNEKRTVVYHPALKRGVTMLSIAAIVFIHILYIIAITPDIHAYVILVEFIPFVLCAVVGLIQVSTGEGDL